METNINTDKLDQMVNRLCRVSEDNYIDPFSRLEWPEELDRDNWFTSPELISIEGTPIWDNLDESQRKCLSFFEAVGFYSINIHGERMLIEGLASRLYRKDKYAVTPYLHHFLDEENKHMIYFGRFCTLYANGPYPEKKVKFDQEYEEGEEDFLFFSKVMVFEEIVDLFNRRQAKDDRLHPLAKEINWLHHFEESRHLGFGREFVKVLWQSYSNKWTTNGLKRIRDTISSYIKATWKEYYNPSVYKDAGLSDPFSIRKMALKHPTSIIRRAEISAPLIKFLSKTGILPNAEELPI
tara:strand:- start:528 stop:1412 length:885 start_codon:yes stop_codon:yes gene_type:complete